MIKISGRDYPEALEEVSLSFLYKSVNTLQEVQQQSESSNTNKYINLIKYLSENLTNLKVYKIGEEKIDVFITGATAYSGDRTYITLATKAVE